MIFDSLRGVAIQKSVHTKILLPCSLFPVPCSLFPVPCSLTQPKIHRIKPDSYITNARVIDELHLLVNQEILI
ncbi:MAG: hypothetical protein ACLBM4_11015 [Dolichospermum sp.]